MKLLKNRKKQQKFAPRSRPARPSEEQGSGVFSYHSARARSEAPLNRNDRGQSTQKQTGRSRALRWQLVPSWLAFVAILCSLGYVLTLDTNPRIIVPSGSSAALLRDEAVYRQAAQKLLRESFTNRSKITIDTLAISRGMQQQFPEIEAAAVALPLAGRRPVLTIRPAVPALILSTRSGLYVLDTKGRAILTAADATSPFAAELPIIIDDSGLNVEVGKSALPTSTITFIQSVLAQLAAKQLVPQTMTLPAVANELHLRFANQPYFVKLNTTSDPRQAAGTFLAVKAQLEGERQLPAEYIDLRVPERAYYK